jgi:hypothetical protein
LRGSLRTLIREGNRVGIEDRVVDNKVEAIEVEAEVLVELIAVKPDMLILVVTRI